MPFHRYRWDIVAEIDRCMHTAALNFKKATAGGRRNIAVQFVMSVCVVNKRDAPLASTRTLVSSDNSKLRARCENLED